jgi:hypothetical protein
VAENRQAGGYDALWVLIIDCEGSNVLDAVQCLWSGTKTMRVTPLTVLEDADGGLRVEDAGRVAGLNDILKEISWNV